MGWGLEVDCRWEGVELRWVTAGIDLAAEFSKVHFDPRIVAINQDVVKYEPNPAQPDPLARILHCVKLT